MICSSVVGQDTLIAVSSTYFTNEVNTLWTEMYLKEESKLEYPILNFREVDIRDKIYEYNQVDTPPKQLNKDSLKSVTIQNVAPCFCEPMYVDVFSVAIIVTKKGEIKNIEQAVGNLSENCPSTMQEIIKEVKGWGRLMPATKNGKTVNVRWFVKINNLNRKYRHPMIQDNERYRKAFIKKKRRKRKKRATK